MVQSNLDAARIDEIAAIVGQSHLNFSRYVV
jgi:hypothetical protein